MLRGNRHGLIVGTVVRAPSYDGEREAAGAMLKTLAPLAQRRTLGADEGHGSDALVPAFAPV